MRQPLLVFGLTSAASAIAFETINFPLGAMIGPMFAVAFLAHFSGIHQKPGVDAHHFAVLLIGLALGNQVTPDIFERIQLWPVSLLIMIVTMVFIFWIVGKLNQRMLKLDAVSAHMAAAPGNLSSALAATEHYGGALSQVAVYQSLRLAFLTLMVPVLFVVPEQVKTPFVFEQSDFISWIFVLPIAWLLTGVLRHFKVTTPGLIVGIFGGAILSLFEIVHLNTPPVFIGLAMMLFGWRIGIDIIGQGLRVLLKTFPPAALSTLAAVSLAFAGSFAVYQLLGFPLIDAALAFMPGGFQVMPVVALEAGADGLYVTTHHLIRVLAMGVLIPFFASYWSRS
jgi:membrane AbrB-like protein